MTRCGMRPLGASCANGTGPAIAVDRKSPRAPCLARAKPIISRPMQRATHDRVECARGSCEADVRLVGADARPGGAHYSSVGPFEPSVAAHSRCVGTNAIGIGA